jgi:hypothetical protein
MGSGSAGIPAALDGGGLTSPASSCERSGRSLKKPPARAVGRGQSPDSQAREEKPTVRAGEDSHARSATGVSWFTGQRHGGELAAAAGR